MNKLIKLSDTHYIIVDDSEIKQNDIVCEKLLTGVYELLTIQTLNDIDTNNQFKITYSTQPLEIEPIPDEKFSKVFDKIKSLSLSEIEEAIYGYNVEKMAGELAYKKRIKFQSEYEDGVCSGLEEGFIKGFKAQQELAKNKLFTIEDMRKAMWEIDRLKTTNLSTEEFKKIVDEYIESVLPKTEWDVEFDEQGKLKLI